MAWLEKRKHWRIRDWVNGKKVTVVKNAGQWQGIAQQRLTDYLQSKAADGKPSILVARRLLIPMACDVFFTHHGPSLKESSRYDMGCRLNVVKRDWKNRYVDSITEYDVRDFLAQFKTIGNRMKYLRLQTTLFKTFAKWNKKGGKVPGYIVKVPDGNPASEWRHEMKAADKKELPRKRVLDPEEWQKFAPHLSRRARAICEIALRRFLRLADIRQITHLSIRGDTIEGLQAKTGEPFMIPALDRQPTKYDFTNFRQDFLSAQAAAGMDYPVNHPLHFTVRDLRRTGATWAYRKTKDLVGISKMLGHTSVKTTMLYLNIDEADRKSIARAVDDLALGR